MNIVVASGWISSEFDIMNTPKGKCLVFDVGVVRDYVRNYPRKSDFISCLAYYSTADHILKYFKKGKPIGLVGHWQTFWKPDSNGNTYKRNYLLISEVHFMNTLNQADKENTESEDELLTRKAIEEYNDSADF